MISFEQAQEIASRSAGGEGVVAIISSMGLKRKETLIELRDKYSDLIREAKRQQKTKKAEDPLPEPEPVAEVTAVEPDTESLAIEPVTS